MNNGQKYYKNDDSYVRKIGNFWFSPNTVEITGDPIKWLKETLESPGYFCDSPITRHNLSYCIAKIEEQYCKLPVNGDGEPIRPGDRVYGKDKREWRVIGFLPENAPYTVSVESTSYPYERKELKPFWCSHRKPETIEGILREWQSRYGDKFLTITDGVYRKYADRIRNV